MSKHTPAPWYWHDSGYRIALMTPKNGHCVVMDFVRKGMQGAQPRFSNRGDAPLGGVMIEADKLDLDHHPDAMLITQAPNLLAACVASYHTFLEMGVKEAELESLKNTILNAGGTIE